MSYKLTIEFKNKQEVIDFLLDQAGQDKSPGVANLEEIKDETIEAPKKSALRSKKEKAPATQEAPAVQPGLDSEAAPVTEPVVQQAPVVESPVTAIDRAAYIAQATNLVAALKATGLADDQLMPEIHKVYAQANCPVNLRISQLEDAQLAVFIPLFKAKVDGIVNSKKENAFI